MTGNFRLKLSFVDVSELGSMLTNASNPQNASNNSSQDSSPESPTSNGSANKLATSSCPVLATCFSAPFQVHSAKKFPGVKESTSLSRAFAQQGVKIPIRKEGKTKDEDDED